MDSGTRTLIICSSTGASTYQIDHASCCTTKNVIRVTSNPIHNRQRKLLKVATNHERQILIDEKTKFNNCKISCSFSIDILRTYVLFCSRSSERRHRDCGASVRNPAHRYFLADHSSRPLPTKSQLLTSKPCATPAQRPH